MPNVLGLKTSTELNIIKRVEGINSQHVSDPLKEFADVFTGLGCVSNVVHHINIKPNVQPVVHPLWGPEVNPHEEEGGAAPGVAPEHATKEQE